MTSKLGDSPRKSAAAYLLFYRRRSDKPLGPEYLQELVADFRNPPQQAHSADESNESDSGEGRLGDPSSILRGSSSNSIGAGVGATTGQQLQARSSNLQGGGNGSAGQQAGQNLMPKTQGTSDDEGISMVDEEIPGNHTQYGTNGAAWSFDALNDNNSNADSDAEMLLDGVNGDANSTAAEQDSDRDDSWNDLEEDFNAGGDGSAMDYDYEDDHAMYSTAHSSGALHLESIVSDDPPAVDINLSDDSRMKMD